MMHYGAPPQPRSGTLAPDRSDSDTIFQQQPPPSYQESEHQAQQAQQQRPMPAPPGTDPDFVVFVSSDGIEFVLPTATARRCGFVTRILKASKFSKQPPQQSSSSAASSAYTSSSGDSAVGMMMTTQHDDGDDDGDQTEDVVASQPPPTSTSMLLQLPDIHSSVLDVLLQFLSEAAARGSDEPLDVARSLAFFDPSSANDRVFVMDMMLAADYLSC